MHWILDDYSWPTKVFEVTCVVDGIIVAHREERKARANDLLILLTVLPFSSLSSTQLHLSSIRKILRAPIGNEKPLVFTMHELSKTTERHNGLDNSKEKYFESIVYSKQLVLLRACT